MKAKNVVVGNLVQLVAHPEHAFKHHSREDFESWGYGLGMVGVVTAVDLRDDELPLNVTWVGLDRPHFRPSELWVDYESVEVIPE